jgi:hypothetical protein
MIASSIAASSLAGCPDLSRQALACPVLRPLPMNVRTPDATPLNRAPRWHQGSP